ncbi:MAG: ABC transporter substrate-binding protein [Thermoplasmata archaeon]|nr:ABC transporter substrate-binding protein [Thermoplasmata archaeon]
MKSAAVILTIIIIIGTLAPGLASSQTETEIILRVAVKGDMTGTNPLANTDYWSVLMTRWLYDSPVYLNPETGEQVPYIAVGSACLADDLGTVNWDDCTVGDFNYSKSELWQTPVKKEAVIFYDFENVTWHDGTQMDIRDVMFSYHAAAQQPFYRGDVNCLMGANYSVDNWLGIEKAWEDGTRAALKFTLETPYWHFFDRTLGVRLLPEHVWTSAAACQKVDGAKIWCDAGYSPNATNSWNLSLAQTYENPEPVGSGIFNWSEWSPGQYISIDTWRSHFFHADYKYTEYVLDEFGRSLARQPYIDGILYRLYSTSDAAILALTSADIDYIAWSLPVTYVQELADTPGVSLEQSPDPGFTYLAYNMGRESFGYDETSEDAGKPLRQAIAHVIDRNSIVQRLLLGLGLPSHGPVASISPWYNSSVPLYSFDPDEAKNILANAGYKVEKDGEMLTGTEALSAARDGTWWLNPDGSPIGSGAGGLIEILIPEGNYDAIRAQSGLMIATQLRDIGIYAEVKAMCFCDIGAMVEQRNFDIYIEPCYIDSDPSVFLYDFFHSDNSMDGLNYAGYHNASCDRTIELARSTDNETVREQAIFEAQASICYDLPYDALFYKTNIEAYRSDKFLGWQADSSGSIFNRGSMRSIRSPSINKLNAQFVSPPSAMVSNSTCTITVIVKDLDGNPLEGALVWMSASLGKLDEETGSTGSNGTFSSLYKAPYVYPYCDDVIINGTSDIIQIQTAKYTDPEGTVYDDAPAKLATITIYPEDARFLSVTISAYPDVINPDMGQDGTPGITYVDVTVKDQGGVLVSGAAVILTIQPLGLVIDPVLGLTDANGKVQFMVTSVDLPNNDGSVAEYILKATATHLDYANITGENSMALTVVDAYVPPPVDPLKEIPLVMVTFIGIAIVLSIIIGAYLLVKLTVFVKMKRKR